MLIVPFLVPSTCSQLPRVANSAARFTVHGTLYMTCSAFAGSARVFLPASRPSGDRRPPLFPARVSEPDSPREVRMRNVASPRPTHQLGSPDPSLTFTTHSQDPPDYRTLFPVPPSRPHFHSEFPVDLGFHSESEPPKGFQRRPDSPVGPTRGPRSDQGP